MSRKSGKICTLPDLVNIMFFQKLIFKFPPVTPSLAIYKYEQRNIEWFHVFKTFLLFLSECTGGAWKCHNIPCKGKLNFQLFFKYTLLTCFEMIIRNYKLVARIMVGGIRRISSDGYRLKRMNF